MFKSITPLQERDSCLALVFLLLIVWFFCRRTELVYAAMAVLLLGMIWPRAFKPFACAWYGLAAALGKVTSSILLSAVWLVMVLPMGLVRRMMGKDALRLREYRRDRQSCFVKRDHVYKADDLINPY